MRLCPADCFEQLRERLGETTGGVGEHRAGQADGPVADGDEVDGFLVHGRGRRLGEVPAEDRDLRSVVGAGVAVLDDLVEEGADIGLGLRGDVLIEVAGGGLAGEDDQLAAGVVDAVEGIGADALDVAVLVLDVGGLTEVEDAALEEFLHGLVGDEFGLLGFLVVLMVVGGN